MRRPVVIGVNAVVSVLALMAMFGISQASAESPYYGQTYAEASAKIRERGRTPVIATVIGSQLPADDCIVTNAYKPLTLDSTGSTAHPKTWMLDLNCNRAVAEAGHPGNSVMTPEGQEAKALQVRAEKMDENVTSALAKGKVPKCGKSESNATKCEKFCDKYGLCSDEVLKYLATL